MKHRKISRWSRLDNAAKIFPSTSTRTDPKVFRFACQLYDFICPHLLQKALDKTLDVFPHFSFVIRKGLFWYYFESCQLHATVTEENLPPCSPLYDPIKKGLLFRVSWYRKRINLEVYHALTDGSGALEFLRRLVYEYLILKHPECSDTVFIDYDASLYQRTQNSFDKYYLPKKIHIPKSMPKAYHVQGSRLGDYHIRVTEGLLPLKETLLCTKKFNVSLTALVAAALICAIHKEQPIRGRNKPIVVSVPVNLRNYFESSSARNFFSIFDVSYTFTNDSVSLLDVAQSISKNFQEQLTPSKLKERMQNLSALQYHPILRIIPLALKDLLLRIFVRNSYRSQTTSVSNLGKITMPDTLCPYIDLFDIFISANRPQICMCSFENHLMLSMTSPFASPEIEKQFFRIFSELELPITIYTNISSEEEL